MSLEDKLLTERYRELRGCFNNLKKELKCCPLSSSEYDEIFMLLSDLNIQLRFMRENIISKRLRLDFLSDLLGRLILGKSIDSETASKVM